MTARTRKVSALVTLLLASASAAAIGQSPQNPPQQPIFRSGVNLVPIDVRVVDNSGRPITDLKQEDFTILENNVPQVIRAFSTQAFTAASPPAPGTTPAVRTGHFDEVGGENRRVFLIVMGRGRHQDVSSYVDALADFVGTRVLPQDYVGVMAWNRATDFTTDHEQLKRVLLKYRDEHARIEQALQEWFSGLRALYGSKEIPPRIQKMIDAVFADATALRPRPLSPAPMANAKKTDDEIKRTAQDIQRSAELKERVDNGFKTLPDPVADITANFNGMTFDEYIAQMTEVMQDVGNLYAAIGYLRFLAGEKHLIFVTRNGVSLPRQEGNVSIARVAADSRIALDLIQTGGTVGAPPVRIDPRRGVIMESVATTGQVFKQAEMIGDLRLMADRTGGQVMLFRTGEDAMRRLDESLKFQYLLGYTPTNPNWDGKFRKVTVKVNRPGANVLAREGYVATEANVALDRREMITFNRIRAAAEYIETVSHIKVKLGQPAWTATDLTVEVTVDIGKVRFGETNGVRDATLDVGIFCGNAKDEPIGQDMKKVGLHLGETEYARAQQQGVTFRVTVPIRGQANDGAVKVVVYDYGADLVGSAIVKVPRYK